MATPVEMPKLSDTMEEGVLVAWLVEEGEEVSAGDVIAQVETDKATMDLEVYDDGVLLKRVASEGSGVPIGGLIAVLGTEGEDISDLLAKYEGDGGGGAEAEPPKAQDEGEEKEESEAPKADAGDAQPEVAVPSGDGAPPAEPQPAGHDDARIKASPLARRMAAEGNLDLSQLVGTGPEGRIIKRDVEAALGDGPPAARPKERKPADRPAEPRKRPPAAPPTPATPAEPGGYERIGISQMRKTIARRLAESKFTAPHFYLTVDLDMARTVDARRRVNETAEANGWGKVSINDFVTKACAAALRLHPAVNSSYLEQEGEIRRHNDVNVAVAVAVEEGLLTPVIRNTDRKGLAQIAHETRELAEKARNRQLQPEDWESSTFTTSNLGMFGIEEFTAIINPPNACILAIGAVREVPVVEDGEIRVGTRMKVTLSCDHRVVDGATGAEFLADVRRLLEEPMTMLL